MELSLYIVFVNQILILIFTGSNTLTEGSGARSRVKRIVDGTPRPKTTAAPLTSEEERERISGTESPHIHDYPDDVYMSPEVRKGEWAGNPIPKKNAKNATKSEDRSAPAKRAKASHKSRNRASPGLIQSAIGGL